MGKREDRKDKKAFSIYQLSNINGYKREAGGKIKRDFSKTLMPYL
jgi:hypothetical protein